MNAHPTDDTRGIVPRECEVVSEEDSESYRKGSGGEGDESGVREERGGADNA